MSNSSNVHSNFLWQVGQLLKGAAPKRYSGKLSGLSRLKREGLSIDSNIGNNSFSYNAGRILHIAPVCEYSEENTIELGCFPVFFDEWNGELLNHRGLKKNLFGKTKRSSTPFYLCDNHNIVLEAWQLVKDYSPRLKVVHLDQHRDDAMFAGDIRNYLIESRICDYISLAKSAGWIDAEHFSFTESSDFAKNPPLESAGRLILNLDLDIFAPSVTHLSTNDKIAMIKSVMPYTELLTIATSPGFIDAERAMLLAELLISSL